MNNAVRNTADKEIVVSLSSIYGQYVITHAHVERKKQKTDFLFNVYGSAEMNDRQPIGHPHSFIIKKNIYRLAPVTQRGGVHAIDDVFPAIQPTWIVPLMNFFHECIPPHPFFFSWSFVVEDPKKYPLASPLIFFFSFVFTFSRAHYRQ